MEGPDANTFYLDMRCGGFGHLAHGWDLPEIKPLITDLPAGAIAIDIGANIGIWSRLLARQCSSGQVFAFEPSSTTYSILKKNCSQIRNVTCIQAAVGGVDGEVSFVGESVPSALRRIAPSGHEGAETVPSVRLASWISSNEISRIDFVKVDVEGFEEDVLCPCLEHLAAKCTTIVFEFIPEFARARSMYGGRRLFTDLTSCNYTVHRIDKGGSRYLNHNGPQDWTNNYIAVPRR